MKEERLSRRQRHKRPEVGAMRDPSSIKNEWGESDHGDQSPHHIQKGRTIRSRSSKKRKKRPHQNVPRSGGLLPTGTDYNLRIGGNCYAKTRPHIRRKQHKKKVTLSRGIIQGKSNTNKGTAGDVLKWGGPWLNREWGGGVS